VLGATAGAGSASAQVRSATPAAHVTGHLHPLAGRDYASACGSPVAGRDACMVLVRTNVSPHVQAAAHPRQGPSGYGYGPSDLQSAYNLASSSATDGAGETVAVVDAYNDPTAVSDLAAYRSAWGLPACDTSTGDGCLSVVNQEGESSPLPPTAPSYDDWTFEESLDVDMVSAICPLCKIDLVEADDDIGDGLYIGEQTAATTLGAEYISNSWGGDESSTDTTYDSEYFGQPGVVYTASAGDSGYGVSYPATSPNVVSVGGTSLNTSSNARGWTESVWGSAGGGEGTGSGCSDFEPQPSWQASLPIIKGACSKRVDNDVAADADPNTGVAIYDTSNGNGGWNEVGGTSASSPMIASVYALAGGNGGGGNNAAESIYNNTGDLYEVTGGSNGSCSPAVLCTATGAPDTYNGPTGWGTPDGLTAFEPAAANIVTVTNPGNQTGKVGDAVSLQISATDSDPGQTLTYSATGLPEGLSISPDTGLITGTPTTAQSRNVTVTATDTTGASGSATFTWKIDPSGVCSPAQLLRNPGFESGAIKPWKGSTGVLANTSEGVPAHTGSWLAWFDGYGAAHTDTLKQAVTSPADCTKATLSFWLYVQSDDPTNAAYDTFKVQVLNSTGHVLGTLHTFSNLNEGTGYVRHFYQLAPYIGQKIILRFTGTETLGGGSNTNFFDDTNLLEVSGGGCVPRLGEAPAC
jgi:hypothetical protein